MYLRRAAIYPVILAISSAAVFLAYRDDGVSARPLDRIVPLVHIDPSAKPARYISEYNLFKDNARQIPNDGLLPYDLNTPLFSDYAAKYRLVHVPPGMHAKYNSTGAFEFPPGSALVKTFSFPKDLRDSSKGERVVETRLLIHEGDGRWIGLPYLWNDDMSDARLAVAGAREKVTWTHTDGSVRSINYIVPNMNQCKQCHENAGKQGPIGPSARHLNKDYPYDTGLENQLLRWSREGILEGLPGSPQEAPRVPPWDDPASGTLERRARGYLDINCGHCHNPKGPAWTSGLDLSYGQSDPVRIGINKPPVAAGRGSANMRFAVVPGDPDNSYLVHRMESTDPGVMMPQLPRQVVHDEGVALIREWIEAMDPAGYGVDESQTPAFLGVQ